MKTTKMSKISKLLRPDPFTFFIILIVLFVVIYICLRTQENFDGTGLVYNVAPEWFHKKNYNIEDWLVNVYPDRIHSDCNNSKRIIDPGLMNYYSQSYSFWRM